MRSAISQDERIQNEALQWDLCAESAQILRSMVQAFSDADMAQRFTFESVTKTLF